MTRATAKVRHDDVARLLKAIQTRGLPINEVMFDGENVRVITGDSGHKLAPRVDAGSQPENFQSLDEYRAWRERERARGT